MPSIAEQKAKVNSKIQDLRKKIQLSEGESKAFYEESESEKRNNKTAITTLRSDIKLLHVRIEEANQGGERSVEKILQQQKQKRGTSACAQTGRVRCADATLRATQYKLHDMVKRVNALIHTSKQKSERLATLKAQLREATCEKAQQEQISIHVLQQNRLAEEKDALKNLRDSRRKAEKTRDSLRTRLHEEEENAYETKREREKRLFEFRRRGEERRAQDLQGMAADRRLSILRTPTRRGSPTATIPLSQDAQELVEAELEKYQHLFTKLKDVLGVTSVDEVVDRLKTQAGTREHLRQLRSVTLEEVTRLKQEKEHLHQELHRVKYATTEDAARLVCVINELKDEVCVKEGLKEDMSLRLDGTMKVLAGVRAGLEHIAEKIQTPEHERPPRAASPLLHLVVLMGFCTERAQHLITQVTPIHIDQKLAEMAEEEKDNNGCVLTSPENIRVSFPGNTGTSKTGQQQVDEGGDSGEEEESLTRKFIKRQAQMIVEAKARKRNRPVSTFKS
ncbi:hypothetical protein Pmani_030125 [Petrolisthes manimaculis]|uniref:Uncharacterized protein n=1 Tax=Petrolisthes manimaculis TaxID=1843537 RepID=A0AAE1NXC3_9EUCA|nr:hypothetical protein Pmani_030125 [Petrolisthes manimaculis]